MVLLVTTYRLRCLNTIQMVLSAASLQQRKFSENLLSPLVLTMSGHATDMTSSFHEDFQYGE